jgi:NitT/TauT family transport system ATP-binding protein
MAAIAALDRVSLRFAGAAEPLFSGLSLSLEQGEFSVVVGASGAGKSTLLRIVAGLIAPTGGSVRRPVTASPGRRAIATVFQEPRLLPWRSVLGNVALGLEGLGLNAAERKARAEAALAQVGLADYAGRWPHALSGGQRQRVGIARALAVEPDLLLMDEPFGALDAITRESLQDELTRLWQKTGKSILFVTHDIEEATYLGDRVLLLGGAPATIRASHRIGSPRPRTRSDPAALKIAVSVKSDLFDLVQDGGGI